MLLLDALRDVDNPEVCFMVQDVVFGEVGVHEAAFVEESAHSEEELGVERGEGGGFERGVFESRGGPEGV
jgi:hypothetical protein